MMERRWYYSLDRFCRSRVRERSLTEVMKRQRIKAVSISYKSGATVKAARLKKTGVQLKSE